jgi:hypothetical protein
MVKLTTSLQHALPLMSEVVVEVSEEDVEDACESLMATIVMFRELESQRLSGAPTADKDDEED